MLVSLVLFSSILSLGARCIPAQTGFDDLSIRTIRFPSGHVERLPIAAIERLRSATPFPRPLTPESFSAARKSLADISILTASTSAISDEAIERLQGHFQRKLWGAGYVDITDSPDHRAHFPRAHVAVPQYATPDPVSHPELQPMLAMVDSAEIRSYVSQLSTAYQTRYYLSLNAREPATWIQSQFASWLGEAQSKFVENAFNQPNVIGRIEAKTGGPNAPIVILGAHLDSTSQTPMESAPGADDDASGVAAIMATMRILKTNNYQGTYAIEAHAYAGEEGGLLGSMNLANRYKLQNKSIRGMLNFDMIEYQPSTATNTGKSSTITILSDPVPEMSAHMAEVVRKYVPTAEQRSVPCGVSIGYAQLGEYVARHSAADQSIYYRDSRLPGFSLGPRRGWAQTSRSCRRKDQPAEPYWLNWRQIRQR